MYIHKLVNSEQEYKDLVWKFLGPPEEIPKNSPLWDFIKYSTERPDRLMNEREKKGLEIERAMSNDPWNHRSFEMIYARDVDNSIIADAFGIEYITECWESDEDNDYDENGDIIPRLEKSEDLKLIKELSFPLVVSGWIDSDSFERCGKSAVCLIDLIELKEFSYEN